MPDGNLPLFPHDFNPPPVIPVCGKLAGRVNRARIVALLEAAWAAGESPRAKCIVLDVGLHNSQVYRHLRALEEQGKIRRRREGQQTYVEAPRS